MPQCQFPIFCCFCVSEKLHRKYSQNWMKQVPEVLFCPEASREPKRRRSGTTRGPHTRLAQPRPWPCHLGVRAPWQPPDNAPLPIRSLGTENPKRVDEISKRVPHLRHRRQQISGDRSLCSGTLPGQGSAPGAISIGLHHRLCRLHRPHRHLHQPCCLI
jgi:hypothetical protein